MLKPLAVLSVAVLAIVAVAACSSGSDSSGTNYSDGGFPLGPAGVDLQGFYGDWEKRVPMNGR